MKKTLAKFGITFKAILVLDNFSPNHTVRLESEEKCGIKWFFLPPFH